MINSLLLGRKTILSLDDKEIVPDDSGRKISKEEIERYEENIRGLEHLKRHIEREKKENGDTHTEDRGGSVKEK